MDWYTYIGWRAHRCPGGHLATRPTTRMPPKHYLMRAAIYTFSCLLPAALAAGQGTVLLDQIGPANASAIMQGVLPQNQDFLNDGQILTDTLVIESFANPDGLPLARIQTVVGGMGGYGGLDGISGMHIMVFQTPEDAELGTPNLMLLDEIVDGVPTSDPHWPLAGSMDLVTVSGGPWACPAGDLWIAVTPINEFQSNGITAQGLSTIGDAACVQVNPSGTGGWTRRDFTLDAAMSITAGPCALPLPELCPGDVDQDGFVIILDILDVLQNWGSTTDGLSRPIGDCAPLPFGDCIVDVQDLLQVVSNFGTDCRPRGACCLGLDGCIEDLIESECDAQGGSWTENTTCATCVYGACCWADETCTEISEKQCIGAGATFQGQGMRCNEVQCPEATIACCLDQEICIDDLDQASCDAFGGNMIAGMTCAQEPCANIINDTCTQAFNAVLGANSFDSTSATDSEFTNPDESMCPNTYLNWNDSRDVWFRYTATHDALLDISTCDAESFDTSLVLYRGTDCSNLEQVACNGDGNGETGCQFYWSRIGDFPIYAGDVLWIRIGGYENAGGPGTLTLTESGDLDAGACCVDGSCIGELLEVHCVSKGGYWVGPWACDDILCGGASGPCTTGVGDDPVHPDLDWIAGVSDTTADMARAQQITATTISTVRVYGLAMQFDGGWASCDTPEFTFDVRTWMDDGTGQPGTLLTDLHDIAASGPYPATVYPTPLGYFTMLGWDIPINATAGDHRWLSVQSNSSESDPCMFLWMSSTEEGGGISLIDEGDGWQIETYGLNYCISE